MKKQVISVALFAVLATMAVSCQKENFVEPRSAVAEVGTVRTVSYAVDGVAHQVTLHGDAEWDAFVDSMMSLSEQGYDVRIINESAASQSPATKDVQTITTTDRNEAKAWAKQKSDEGYAVEINHSNGVYTCIAIS